MAKKNNVDEASIEVSKKELSSLVIKEINKGKKGDKVAWCLADGTSPTHVDDWISTGSTLLDYCISNKRGGGIPVRKIIEIVGEEASGKSLLLNHILAETQRRGGLAVLLDEENALDPTFANRIGLDTNKLVYMQCGTVEKVGENVEKIINIARANNVKNLITIGWDSVAATPPEAELAGDYDPNSRIGLQAKTIAKMMRKLTQTFGKENITFVCTNQLKVKIGVMFGDPMGTPGGKAIPYHASVRIRLTRSSEIKDDIKSTYAVHTRAKVFKNRVGPPLRTCEFDIHFASGIDDASSIRDYLHRIDLIRKANGWMYLKRPTETEPDREVQFRSKDFAILMKDNEDFKNYVLDLVEQNMIISYDSDGSDIDIDPDSYLDNEAIIDMVN